VTGENGTGQLVRGRSARLMSELRTRLQRAVPKPKVVTIAMGHVCGLRRLSLLGCRLRRLWCSAIVGPNRLARQEAAPASWREALGDRVWPRWPALPAAVRRQVAAPATPRWRLLCSRAGGWARPALAGYVGAAPPAWQSWYVR